MASPQPGSHQPQSSIHHCLLRPSPTKNQTTHQNNLREEEAKGDRQKTLHTFKCSTCQEVFTSPSALQSHKLSVHGKDKQQQYTCGKCTKTFSSRAQLSKHQRSHSAQRPFQCPHCHKLTRLQLSYATTAVHTQERNRLLFDCGKAFMQAICLRIHMTQHSGERPHACPHCSKSYPTLSNSSTPTITHRGEALLLFRVWEEFR